MNVKNKVIATASAVGGLLSSVVPALAAPLAPPPDQKVVVDIADAGFKITDIGSLLTGLLNMVMFVAALLVFFYLIWGGIQWITSGGDKGKTEEARNKITAAIIGLAVLAASYAIFLIVLSFLGVGNPFAGTVVIPKAYGE